ncbi:MAG: DUF2064 domain-containing protein [Bdellovibrionales bacterium]|nr:DUF2064 domain-containing protein [Bdellovibrionales bacterium]
MHRHTAKTALAVFTKIPGAAPVKTRLAAHGSLSQSHHLRLATALMADTLLACAEVQTERYIVSCPDTTLSALEALCSSLPNPPSSETLKRFTMLTQIDGSFEERLNALLSDLADDGRAVVIVGSDTPTLSYGLLEHALASCASGRFVLGPVGREGVYLIGIPAHAQDRRFAFTDEFTSRDQVGALMTSARTFGWDTLLLEPLQDVDTMDDLIAVLTQQSIKSEKLNTYLCAVDAGLITI